MLFDFAQRRVYLPHNGSQPQLELSCVPGRLYLCGRPQPVTSAHISSSHTHLIPPHILHVPLTS